MATNRPEAAHYDKLDDGRMQCRLCPHECGIADGKKGICRTRENAGGRLELLNYGEYTSFALDPIEKKPLYHFHPGGKILSIGGKGCNLTCAFCQNCEISQGDPPARHVGPEELAREVVKRMDMSIGLAYTYNEPFIWFEFIRDSAPLIRKAGGRIALVTNGFVNPEPLAELLPHIDAMNVDLKAFDDEFYRKHCGGRIEPVKETIAAAVRAGVHVELTLLLIPTLNDSPVRLHEQAAWIASLSKDIPFHISRYFPCYKMDIPATPAPAIRKAREIAMEYLNYVYVGNVGEAEAGRTFCPSCRHAVIERRGYETELSGLDGSNCANCGAAIAVRR
ncbi:MAG: AmmeMemoRadiSam system radical SAM enzyme [bacterium]